mgnify:CR=1 FL=1
MQAAQQLYFTELICELFDFNNLQQRIQYAAFVVYGNLQKLYPELSVQYSNTRDAFRSTVTDVGERFIQQLKRLIAGNTNYLKDETIQERVRKGVAYFLEQIDRLCSPLQDASDVEIDNKETRKTVKNALDKWNEDLRIKLSTLQGCQEGFTISSYLSAKAKASIEQPSAPTARKRSTKGSDRCGQHLTRQRTRSPQNPRYREKDRRKLWCKATGNRRRIQERAIMCRHTYANVPMM